ncbi:MAG: glycosyltransferase family 4 protein [Pseudomonadales bacterium]
MNKILIMYGLDAGGSERVAVTLANAWAERGDNVSILSLSDGESHYSLDERINLTRLNCAKPSKNIFYAFVNNGQRLYRIRHFLRRQPPSWILGIASTMNILSIVANIGLKHRVIATEHIHPPAIETSLTWKLSRKLLYRLSACVTAPTAETADWLKRHTSAQRVVDIPNPIRMPLPKLLPKVDPGEYIDPTNNLILAVGRLEPQKGFDLLLNAYSSLFRGNSNWRLAILGEGTEREDLADYVRAEDMDSSVFLPGVVGNMGDWYRRADVFVLSSRFEGFGYVLAEAMAHGCACISFDCETGPSTIITNENEGILVPPENVSALGKELQRLMADENLRTSLGQYGQERATDFREEKIIERWEDLFRSIAQAEQLPIV